MCSRYFEQPVSHNTSCTLRATTGPGLSWNALLKKTGVELELLTDWNMHLFIEKGLRGRISMVSRWHAKSNNPLTLPDPEKPITYIAGQCPST